MSDSSSSVSPRPLLGKWDLYYHLPQDKNWDLSSYKLIIGNIDTAEKTAAIVDALTANMMKYCMLFVMRNGITPMWEDPKNRNGGCFSYKVMNKHVPEVWKTMFYALCGETLCTEPKYNHLINGIILFNPRFRIRPIWICNLPLLQPGDTFIVIIK
jgi:hypothetical protein